MKKQFFLTLILIISGLHLLKAQARIDTVSSILSNNDLRHSMMADKNDRWIPLFLNGFHLWMKSHSAIGNKDRKHIANISYYGKGTLVQLNSQKQIELAVTDITPQNANKYLYHVVVNDSVEIVHWTKPTVFRSNKFTKYAYLDAFDSDKKIIKLEIYAIDNYKDKAVVIFNGGYMPVPKIHFVVLNYNNKYLFQPDKQEYIPDSKQKFFDYNDWHSKPISFVWSDQINHIAIQMNNVIQSDIYHVYLKRTVDHKTDTVMVGNNWHQSYYSPDPESQINSSYFNRPGDYEIIVKPEMPENFELKDKGIVQRIPFTVLPGPIVLSLKTVELIILIILTTGGFIFVMYRDRQKQKLAKEAQNKQIATLQLQGVRAQLNPHFIFNALAGVQNLMNKNEVENANKYLARFARLTRNILDDGQKELTTIEHEAAMLTDYLQMEQMRFGFQFSIDIDEGKIDQQIEIPAMLLQPFVENAIKHGVSSLKNEGMVIVSIKEKDTDIILSVKDNGKSFSTKQPGGMGIKLCEERIKLLNSIYKNTSILLHINSDSKGTLITIELKNWL